jgi:hypothetical protein
VRRHPLIAVAIGLTILVLGIVGLIWRMSSCIAQGGVITSMTRLAHCETP